MRLALNGGAEAAPLSVHDLGGRCRAGADRTHGPACTARDLPVLGLAAAVEHDEAMGVERFRAQVTADSRGHAVITVPFDPDAAWARRLCITSAARSTAAGCG